MYGGGGKAFKMPNMPKTLTCYICGRGYGTRSLKIHLKTCNKKWHIEESKKPRHQRRPVPNPPPGLMELLSKPRITRKDLDRYNNKAFDQYNTESLNTCPHCGRTFGDKPFKNHSKICSADKPFKPLNRTGRKPGQAAGKVGRSGGGGGRKINRKRIGGASQYKGGGLRKKYGKAFGEGGGGGGGGGYGGGGQDFGDMAIGGGGGYDLNNPDAYGGAPVATVPCSKCGRNFGEDRVAKHERVCKVNKKPRKVKRMHKKVNKKQLMREKAMKPQSKWKDQHKDFQDAMKYNRMMERKEGKSGGGFGGFGGMGGGMGGGGGGVERYKGLRNNKYGRSGAGGGGGYGGMRKAPFGKASKRSRLANARKTRKIEKSKERNAGYGTSSVKKTGGLRKSRNVGGSSVNSKPKGFGGTSSTTTKKKRSNYRRKF